MNTALPRKTLNLGDKNKLADLTLLEIKCNTITINTSLLWIFHFILTKQASGEKIRAPNNLANNNLKWLIISMCQTLFWVLYIHLFIELFYFILFYFILFFLFFLIFYFFLLVGG